MAVNIKTIKKWFRALVSFVERHQPFVIGFLLPFFVVFLVAVLFALSSCTSKHYFSVNAEEMSNPSILYSDSTGLQNPM